MLGSGVWVVGGGWWVLGCWVLGFGGWGWGVGVGGWGLGVEVGGWGWRLAVGGWGWGELTCAMVAVRSSVLTACLMTRPGLTRPFQ